MNIEQDVREMERRKRVDAIMSSKLFREELEKVRIGFIDSFIRFMNLSAQAMSCGRLI